MSKPKTDPVQRFWSHVNKTEGCWLWTASTSSGKWPYGQYVVDGRRYAAHRYSFAVAHGPIAPGQLVCHRCDNTLCVRPDHLFLGSPQDNTQDAIKKGRMHRGERSGQSKLTAEQVMAIRREWSEGVGCKELAAKHGITRSGAHAIAIGRVWRHLPVLERDRATMRRIKSAGARLQWRSRAPMPKDSRGRFIDLCGPMADQGHEG